VIEIWVLFWVAVLLAPCLLALSIVILAIGITFHLFMLAFSPFLAIFKWLAVVLEPEPPSYSSTKKKKENPDLLEEVAAKVAAPLKVSFEMCGSMWGAFFRFLFDGR